MVMKFSQQKEIERQQKIIEDLEDIISKIRWVCIFCYFEIYS